MSAVIILEVKAKTIYKFKKEVFIYINKICYGGFNINDLFFKFKDN